MLDRIATQSFAFTVKVVGEESELLRKSINNTRSLAFNNSYRVIYQVVVDVIFLFWVFFLLTFRNVFLVAFMAGLLGGGGRNRFSSFAFTRLFFPTFSS